jgi:hypothetical protein
MILLDFFTFSIKFIKIIEIFLKKKSPMPLLSM